MSETSIKNQTDEVIREVSELTSDEKEQVAGGSAEGLRPAGMNLISPYESAQNRKPEKNQ